MGARPIEDLQFLLSQSLLRDVLGHRLSLRNEAHRDYWVPPTAAQRRFYVNSVLRAMGRYSTDEIAALLAGASVSEEGSEG